MEYELYHYGRKGMKWYQNIFTKHKERVAAKKKRKAEKDKVAEEKRKASVAEQKEKIRNSRSAEQVYKNAHLFTDKELTEIYNRLNTENNIKNLIPAKVNKGKKFMDNAAATGKSLNSMISEGTKLYKQLDGIFKKSRKDAPSAEAAKNTPDSKNSKNKEKSKSKVFEGIVEDIPGYKNNNDGGGRKSNKTTIDAEGWSVVNDDTITTLARSMTRGAAGNTVNFVKNNHDRISSGTSFVSGMLGLPVPDDD